MTQLIEWSLKHEPQKKFVRPSRHVFYKQGKYEIDFEYLVGREKDGMVKWSLKRTRSAFCESSRLEEMAQVEIGHFSLRKTPLP